MAGRRLVAGMLLAVSAPSASAIGRITMTSSPYPDSIGIDVAIEDAGDKASCTWFAIARAGVDIFYIRRDLGYTITPRFVDTNVSYNTQYCCEMALRQYSAPIPCVSGELCDAFDCFCQIGTCASTGSDPARR